jgi:choline kinase
VCAIQPPRTPPTGLVLAAGLGRRLGDLTADRPKALLELRGKTLLERLLVALAEAGVEDAVVVTGHFAERVDRFVAGSDLGISVRTVFNPEYGTANNIVSFLCAADSIRGGCLLLNSDIVVDSSVIRELADRHFGSWLAVDFDEPLGAEEMKVQLDDEGRVSRLNKELSPDQCVGEYIGALRLDAAGARASIASARRLVASGGTNLYYEHAIDAAAADVAARPLPTSGRAWTEIDDEIDYARAMAILDRREGRGS